jgi:transcriptional regulator with XRE-family HTH domain
VITGQQIRAARGLLDWSLDEASLKSGVSLPTIHRFERTNGVPKSRSHTLVKLQAAFEDAGVEFVGSPTEGPGVRLWLKRQRPMHRTQRGSQASFQKDSTRPKSAAVAFIDETGERPVFDRKKRKEPKSRAPIGARGR